MKVVDKLKEWLNRLRALPEPKKKIVLWTTVVIIAIPMFIIWVRGAVNSLSDMGTTVSQIDFPSINLPDAPSFSDLGVLENFNQYVTSGEAEIVP